MSILPVLNSRIVIQKLTHAGFLFVYAKGSHYFFKHPTTNKITSVPVHGGKDIGRGLLSKIVKQAGLSSKEFINL